MTGMACDSSAHCGVQRGRQFQALLGTYAQAMAIAGQTRRGSAKPAPLEKQLSNVFSESPQHEEAVRSLVALASDQPCRYRHPLAVQVFTVPNSSHDDME